MTSFLTICLNSSRDVLAEALVDIEHVKVNSSQLDDERVSHSLTGSDVGLQDTAQLFHSLWVLQDVHVLRKQQSIMHINKQIGIWMQILYWSFTLVACWMMLSHT